MAKAAPTGNPYETRPASDGYLTYGIIPIPDGLLIVERDVMVTMPDGVSLACNVYRLDEGGRCPVTLGMTPYGKDKTPPVYSSDGSFAPQTYPNYVDRLYTGGIGLGHQKISVLTAGLPLVLERMLSKKKDNIKGFSGRVKALPDGLPRRRSASRCACRPRSVRSARARSLQDRPGGLWLRRWQTTSERGGTGRRNRRRYPRSSPRPPDRR
jgi:hypothetical protein